jgi:hypothetical protein
MRVCVPLWRTVLKTLEVFMTIEEVEKHYD